MNQGVYVGDLTVAGQVAERGKYHFVDAVVAAITSGPVELAVDTSGYGEGGWHTGADALSREEAYEIALDAYYNWVRVPAPPRHLLTQEAAAWAAALVKGPADPTVEAGTADVADYLAGFAGQLLSAWSKDTAADPARWTRTEPSTGQCAVTALAVQDKAGGQLLRYQLDGDSHYANLIDGKVVDYTRAQFRTWAPLGAPTVRERADLMANANTRRRYELLCERLGVPAQE